jgi:cation transport regulator
MPYGPKETPQAVVNLPKGAQSIYKDTFNAVYDETKDEDKARQAAWANVKREYDKDEEGNWTKKKDTEELEIEPANLTETITISQNLSEAEFNDTTKTAVVTAIVEGWSLNYTDGKQRFYSPSAVSDVAELLNSSRKLYIDHSKTANRSMKEWTATCNKSWEEVVNEKKVAKAEIDFTENPNTIWLFSEAKKHPSEIGLSIDGRGELRLGKVAGKDAAIVESVKQLNSLDFVTVPAAGGKVERVFASIDENKALYILHEAYKTFDQILTNIQKNENPFIEYEQAISAIRGFVSELIWQAEVTNQTDLDKIISDSVNSFGEKLKKSIGEIKKNQEPSKQESKNKEHKMDLSELKKDHPELVKQLTEEVKADIEANKKADNTAEKLTETENKLKEAETQLAEKETKLAEAENKIAQYDAVEKAREKAEAINGKLKDAGVQDKVTETYVANLNKLDIEVAEALIKEFADALKKNEGKIKGLGPDGKVKEEKEEKKDLTKINYGKVIKGEKE